MAIIGVGIELVDVGEIKGILEKDGDRSYRNRIFSDLEQAYCEKSVTSAERYGVRLAAKEAFRKAVGARERNYRHIVVEKKKSGQPYLSFSPELKERLERHGPVRVQLSLTHTASLAWAMVIVEK